MISVFFKMLITKFNFLPYKIYTFYITFCKAIFFKAATQTKKQVFLTLITALGLQSNIHSVGLMDNDFDSAVLFEA